MKRTSTETPAVLLSCLILGVVAALPARGQAKKVEVVKPPWQRLLQGTDAKTATEQEKKLAQLQEAGQFAAALKVAEALAELRDKAQGVDHWEAVNARFQVEAIRRVLTAKKEDQQSYARAFALQREADAFTEKGRYGEAQPLLERVLLINRSVLGDQNRATAGSYTNLAYNHFLQGKYGEAEEGFNKALAIFRKTVGEEHPDTAATYNNLAGNWDAQGKLRTAEEGFRKALAIQRKVLGEEDSQTAGSYTNLASNLSDQGKIYGEAEEGFRKALAIFRRELGEENSITAYGYNNLASNLNDQGKYRESEQGYRKALAIHRKVLGEEHPDTATNYNNVAASLYLQGKYREAEEGYSKALIINRKVLGEEHPKTAMSYNNLAHNLHVQGKYQEAEEVHSKALAIRRKVLGEEHPSTAVSYQSLALNLDAQSKHKEAEDGHRKALAIYRKVLGEEHPDTARSYNNLAHNLDARHQHEQAEEGHRKALSIRRKALGEEHPDTAISYNSLAFNMSAQGKYREAEEDYRKALAIRRTALGEEHPDTAQSFNNLAAILYTQGKYREAESLLVRAVDSFAKARLHVAATGLERATFTSKRSPLLLLAAVLARKGKLEDAWRCFEESLARGTWDDLATRLRRPPAERDKQTQLTVRIDRLNQLLAKTNEPKPTSEQNKKRDDLLGQLRRAYDELAAFTLQCEKEHGPVAGQVFSRSQVQDSLPTDTALLAWLDIEGKPKAFDPNGEHWAILLRSAGPPIWVRLRGSGDRDAWTHADTQLPTRLREAIQSAGSAWQPLAQRLCQQRLDPLAPHLKGVHRLIVLPSTALAGVPVEVIAENYTVSYAHSGTMYAHLLHLPAPTSEGMLAVADPVFDPPRDNEQPQALPPGGVLVTMVLPGSNAASAGLKANDVLLRYGDADLAHPKGFKTQPESTDPNKRVPVSVWRDGKKLPRPLLVLPGKLGVVFAQEPAPQAMAAHRRIDRLLASRSGDEARWDRLPGTRFEVASLHRLFENSNSVRVLLDSDSSEQRLEELAQSGALGKYRYLHLATHGQVNEDFPLRSAVILSRDHLPDDKQRTELLLSGQPIADGRLTAEEALQRWNLNCELVTLSACETALGKYESGEGYVGFAQALILCGSRSVCLSLWKVDDTATALLIERFYQNLLGKRAGLRKPMAKAAALAEAKTWLRELPRSEALKCAASLSEGVMRGSRKKLPALVVPPSDKSDAKNPPSPSQDRPYAHPYYWAAFTLVGAGMK